MDVVAEEIYTINFFTENYTFIGSVKRLGVLPPVGKVLHLPKLANRADGLVHFQLNDFCYQEDKGVLRPHFMAYAISAELAKSFQPPEPKPKTEIRTSKKQDRALLKLIKS